MASKVSVANIALRSIGENPITSFSDGTRVSDMVSARFDEVLDGELSAYPWNSATSRASLPMLSSNPDWGFSYAYEIPADCLRVLKSNIPDYAWRIEGKTLVTSQKNVAIIYTRHTDDMNELSIRVRQIVGFRLAAELCQPITQDKSLSKYLWKKYKDQLSLAMHADAQEGRPFDLEESIWLTARD